MEDWQVLTGQSQSDAEIWISGCTNMSDTIFALGIHLGVSWLGMKLILFLLSFFDLSVEGYLAFLVAFLGSWLIVKRL